MAMLQGAEHLAEAVANDPELKRNMIHDPEGTLRSMAMPLQTDVWIYRAVVGSLGGALVLVVIAAAGLAFYGKPIPDVLTALGSAAVGAMAGLLAPAPGR